VGNLYEQCSGIYKEIMRSEHNDTVKSLRTAFQIIDEVTNSTTDSVSDIATELEVTTSTIYNHLAMLEDADYISNNDNEISIGTRFLEIGGKMRYELDIYNYGRKEIDELANQTGELSNMMIEEDGEGVQIYLAEGENAIASDTYMGRRFKLHTSAMGKAILAQYKEEQVDEILNDGGLKMLTQNTISDPELLKNELERIAKQGYAKDDEERLEGVRCVAAPVTVDGEVLGAISVSGPTSRIKGDVYDDELPELIQQTANMIELSIKYD